MTAEQLPEELHLQWTRNLPQLKPAFENPRMQFDAGYEPIVVGSRLFLASSLDDSLTAYDTATGQQLWRFYADGPLRTAPVAWGDRVCFGSDDGHVYCLNATDGTLCWRFAAAPSRRLLLGNGRMISMWPVRGGPVLHNGRLYFAAGVWPSEGVFLYALEAESGRVVWRNDRASFIYGMHPHRASAMGGITPQGYLLVNGDELIVPCGMAYPASFDLATGKLKSFQLPEPGRLPGGWFAALTPAQRRGQEPAPWQVTFDKQVNTDRHEDDWRVGRGESDVRTTIRAGQRQFRYQDGYPGVEGDIHSMVVASGQLFVVTTSGKLYCFGTQKSELTHPPAPQEQKPVAPRDPAVEHLTRFIGTDSSFSHGHALVWGERNGAISEHLIQHTELQLVVHTADRGQTLELRQRWDRAGWYGTRVAVLGPDASLEHLPAYFANLIVVQDTAETGPTAASVTELYRCLRPYGGTALFILPEKNRQQLAETIRTSSLPRAETGESAGFMVLTRAGALPGASDYTTPFQPSEDDLVQAPLSVLWYDDEIGFFKRCPPPMFVEGVMRAYDQLWTGYPDGDRPPYKLAPPTFMDAYTGRALSPAEAARAASRFPDFDANAPQPNQYRPPTQRDAWKPDAPLAGQRVNPLTGQLEPRAFPKSYGCDGGLDYGFVYTMRSGTAAFYDKRLESGTVHVSGPRSGCTNSIVPACGLLNLPYYYKGCTCSYPLPASLAMVNMPETFEQWSTWGATGEEPTTDIQRVGINFGAPGDRMTRAGTLWLDYPNVGGPSPAVDVAVEPADVNYFYQHSLFVRGGEGWPWVAASGVEGVRRITVKGLRAGKYHVRLYFAEPQERSAEPRIFDVALQDQPCVKGFDLVKSAGGALRSVVVQRDNVPSDGALEVLFTPRAGEPLLSGLEIVAAGSVLDDVSRLPER